MDNNEQDIYFSSFVVCLVDGLQFVGRVSETLDPTNYGPEVEIEVIDRYCKVRKVPLGCLYPLSQEEYIWAGNQIYDPVAFAESGGPWYCITHVTDEELTEHTVSGLNLDLLGTF